MWGVSACAAVSLVSAGDRPNQVRVSQQGARVEITSASVAPGTVQVQPLHSDKLGAPLMGQTEVREGGMAFIPAAPLPAGQRYRASWRAGDGQSVSADFATDAARQVAPTVRLTPQATLPANALKIYLHFTEPMEQGVFLERLRLVDRQGKEVIGPFRETELWSPDGRRLTVWFHPGRQKAGVNLNVDEGPVLQPNTEYSLIVAGEWRSSGGVALGEDKTLRFATGAADHACPLMAEWKLSLPQEGTKQPLHVEFSESLDPAMLPAALLVRRPGAAEPAAGRVEVEESGGSWSFHPSERWAKGAYELQANPSLEDLAGNTLEKPFEVDLAAPAREAAVTARRFSTSADD